MDWEKACGKCPMNCCKSKQIFVSDYDAARIEALGHKGFRDGKRMKHVGELCIFLDNGKCAIQDVKPLDCKAFPMTFTIYGDNRIFLLELRCPQFKAVTDDWLSETKELIKKETAHWTEKEKKDYSGID